MKTLVFIAYCVLMLNTTAQSQNKPPFVEYQTLKSLTNEPSRQTLFERMKKEELRNSAAEDLQAAKTFSLLGPFVFPYDALNDRVNKIARNNSIFGIDISHYTPSSIPFATLAEKNVKFVYTKASQGTGFKDATFVRFWNVMGSLPSEKKLHRGAYHFLTAEGSYERQAAVFLAVLEKGGGLKATDLPPVLDLEWDIPKKGDKDAWSTMTADQILKKVEGWISIVEAQTSRKPILYTSSAWVKERINTEAAKSKLFKLPIWIADYSQSSRAVEIPKVHSLQSLVLWQFTDGAKIDGDFKTGLDANIFNGSTEEFYKKFDVKKF